MAAAEEKDDKQKEAPQEAEAASGGGKGRIVLGLLAVILVAGAGAGGAVAGTQLISPAPAQPSVVIVQSADPADEPVFASVAFNPIVVDVHDAEGESHHLKVALAVELPELLPEKEFELYSPRAREAAVGYLRALAWEKASDPKQYEEVRSELSETVTKAVGKDRVKRVLITDYVAQ